YTTWQFDVLMSYPHSPITIDNYTLSLHDALPICRLRSPSPRRKTRHSAVSRTAPPAKYIRWQARSPKAPAAARLAPIRRRSRRRSEEHTSELQSPDHLVCRLLLEKKNKSHKIINT